MKSAAVVNFAPAFGPSQSGVPHSKKCKREKLLRVPLRQYSFVLANQSDYFELALNRNRKRWQHYVSWQMITPVAIDGFEEKCGNAVIKMN